MKKNIGKLAVSLMLTLLLPLALILTGASLPRYYQKSYYAQLPELHARLRQTEGKKLVVVGNSDVAFGLEGALLERLLAEKGFDYTVCPFGLYGAVGTSAMLALSEDYLEAGDLVVLVAEPSSETLSTYFGANSFWKCAENQPSLLLSLNSSQQGAALGSYISYLQERCRILWDGTPPEAEGVYARAAFNERCDMVYDRMGNTMALGFDTANMIDFATISVSAEFARQVEEYCCTAERKRADVIVSFSPVNASAVIDRSQTAVDAYFSQVNAALPCAVISDPNRYILESGWFYDSNLHLNSSGAVLRTTLLAEDILAYLGCFEPLDVELPEMPPSIAVFNNSAADTGMFTYEPIADGAGCLISGLTERGAAADVLKIPAAYEGRPVVGFRAGAFPWGTTCMELHIPASIETLPDDLFQNCGELIRLVFEPRDTLCAVGAHTFDGGEQIKVFVPAEDYAMYRDGIGCEGNPWEIYLERIETY